MRGIDDASIVRVRAASHCAPRRARGHRPARQKVGDRPAVTRSSGMAWYAREASAARGVARVGEYGYLEVAAALSLCHTCCRRRSKPVPCHGIRRGTVCSYCY
eukprot:scaffold40_cov413-Prasinococcus_capsulatus_cf.AAC.15